MACVEWKDEMAKIKIKEQKIEDVVEEVLKCHSDENELLIALKSL